MEIWLCSACERSTGSALPCDSTSATPVSSQDDSIPNKSMPPSVGVGPLPAPAKGKAAAIGASRGTDVAVTLPEPRAPP